MLPTFLRTLSVPTLAGGLAVGAQYFLYGSAPRTIAAFNRFFTNDSARQVASYGVLFSYVWASSLIGETLNNYALPALLKAAGPSGAASNVVKGAGNLLLEPALVGVSNMYVSKLLFVDANTQMQQNFMIGAASNLAANLLVRGTASAFGK